MAKLRRPNPYVEHHVPETSDTSMPRPLTNGLVKLRYAAGRDNAASALSPTRWRLIGSLPARLASTTVISDTAFARPERSASLSFLPRLRLSLLNVVYQVYGLFWQYTQKIL